MRAKYKNVKKIGCFILGIWSSIAVADVPISSLGVADPVLIYQGTNAEQGTDIQNYKELGVIPLDYAIPMSPLVNNIPGWPAEPLLWPYYQLTFQAAPGMIPSGHTTTTRVIYRITDNLGIGFGLNDNGATHIAINNPNEKYCVVPTGTGCTESDYKEVDDTGQMALKFVGILYYIPKDNSNYFDPNSDKPFVDAGTITLGRGTLAKKHCPLVGGWDTCTTVAEKATFDLKLNYTVKITPQTCYLDASQLNHTVPMGKVITKELNDNNMVMINHPIDFNFKCPKTANVTVNLQAKDLNKPDNTSAILSLSSDSTATGVGIGLADDNDRPLVYSPDFNSVSQQEPVFSSTNQTNYIYRLRPYFVKVNRNVPATPGSVHAAMQFRFTYK